ncbi:hypothetical protein BVX98_03155 [bacterium F11]|nr:hypothetical protein BVX98_03155 [bacterium F11]
MKTKVVHLITLLELGGAQGNTLYTVTHLNAEKHQAHLWAGKGAYWDQQAIKDLGANNRVRFFPNLVRSISPLRDILVLFQLISALKKEKPHILHTHSSKAGILGRLAGWLAGVPILIHTFHGFGFNEQQKPWTKAFFIFLEKWIAKKTHCLIFVSEANMALATKIKLGNPSKYQLIRSGIPIQQTREVAKNTNSRNLKTALCLPLDNKVVVTIGAFKPQKNLDHFIEVSARVLKSIDNVSFLIIGDGKLKKKLEDLIIQWGLEGKVHLLGWRQDIPSLLSISNAFAMTSLWEGLPRALVEALVLKIPAVCYDTDGIHDLLSLGGGYLIPQGQKEEMAKQLIAILSENSSPCGISHRLENKISSEFDIDNMVRRQESLYFELLNQK